MRTSLGISKIPVDSETDPGFGPDTEQRRVEFASKLEQEAFSIAIGDAEKLAKSNLITALKLWGNEDAIKFVEILRLREIMIIWLFFEIAYLSKVWRDCLSDTLRSKFTSSNSHARKFPIIMLAALHKDIPETYESLNIPKECIQSVREAMGGDLVFALKQKNEDEIIKLYEMTYAKLPFSLRKEFYDVIRGVNVDYGKVIELLKKNPDDLLDQLIQIVVQTLSAMDHYSLDKNVFTSMVRVIDTFDKRSAITLRKLFNFKEVQDRSEIKEKVKKLYGIEDKGKSQEKTDKKEVKEEKSSIEKKNNVK